MKNCLIVIVVLIGCFVVAAYLALYQPWDATFSPAHGDVPRMIAQWRDFDDPDLVGLDVTVGTNEMDLDVRGPTGYKRVVAKGHWSLHAFYCDSQVDSPPEVMVAQELKNEDLQVDIGRFVPSHPRKIVCVKMERITDQRPPYPVYVPGQTVTYPPPKGLIREGMLQCDLESLPWHADKVEMTPSVHEVDVNKLSDGKSNNPYFGPMNQGDKDEYPPSVYFYHSDRNDASKLLVTVHHGRVTEVTGGAEETSDIPYQLPLRTAPPGEGPPPQEERSWGGWLFDLFFTK